MSLLPLTRDAWSAPFFDAALQGRLSVLRCDDCGKHSGPQARRCAYCSSERVAWVDSTGAGEIVTWTVPYRRDGQAAVADYVVAIVQLDEGPWIHVHGSPETTLHTGGRASIRFESVQDGEPLPILVVDE
jgi:uncharacterized OB-fold protein